MPGLRGDSGAMKTLTYTVDWRRYSGNQRAAVQQCADRRDRRVRQRASPPAAPTARSPPRTAVPRKRPVIGGPSAGLRRGVLYKRPLYGI